MRVLLPCFRPFEEQLGPVSGTPAINPVARRLSTARILIMVIALLDNLVYIYVPS